MTSLNRKQQGFTIVELLIVIVVIGILAGLVITTFNGIQQKGRDTERQTDIKALHSQVEAYYAQAGAYPTLAQFNAAGWRSANMKGLDDGALKDPKGAASTLVAAAAANSYSYATPGCTAPASNETDPATAGTCASYTLTATLEGKIDGQPTYSKAGLNN